MNYFRKNKSNVYVMLLDATKAFDKVNYVKLFYQLIDRGLNPFIIRCLLYMYTHQCLNVSWNKFQSKYFPTTNGVKQGGVLSPILFSVYIDELDSNTRDMAAWSATYTAVLSLMLTI